MQKPSAVFFLILLLGSSWGWAESLTCSPAMAAWQPYKDLHEKIETSLEAPVLGHFESSTCRPAGGLIRKGKKIPYDGKTAFEVRIGDEVYCEGEGSLVIKMIDGVPLTIFSRTALLIEEGLLRNPSSLQSQVKARLAQFARYIQQASSGPQLNRQAIRTQCLRVSEGGSEALSDCLLRRVREECKKPENSKAHDCRMYAAAGIRG